MQNLCLHTHNFFCDGKASIQQMVESAVNQGVTQIGISSHAPLKIPNKWSMSINDLENYRMEILLAGRKYREEIAVFLSLEIDYIPGFTYEFDFFRDKLKLDYTIGSIHLVKHPETNELWFIDGDKKTSIQNMQRVFNGDVRAALSAYFGQTREMIRTQKPDIIGHLDKAVMNLGHLFDVEEVWYQEEITETLELVKKYNCIVEANTRGLYKGKWQDTFPSKSILTQCYHMGIPVVISSDAHRTTELLANYETARQILRGIGYTQQMARAKTGWIAVDL